MVKQFRLGEPARRSAKAAPEPAAQLPVARVVLDTPVAHLAREFDYLVPQPLAAAAQPGVRVKVKFGNQDLTGFVTARSATVSADSAVSAQLSSVEELVPLKKVVSPEPVLQPQILRLAQAVADFYGGTLPDVLRFAIPPRHARTETEFATTGPNYPPMVQHQNGSPTLNPWLNSWAQTWRQYHNGPEFLEYLTKPHYPTSGSADNQTLSPSIRKFVWTPLPGLAAPKPPKTVPDTPMWAAQIAALVALVQQTDKGGGVLIVAPDINDVNRILAALSEAEIPNVARLVAEDGVEARYRAFLAVERGQAQVVVGTRSATFAPVANLRLMILWGDGDQSLTEPHAPHFNARQVLALRSDQTGTPLLVGAIGRTVPAQAWVQAGTAVSLTGFRTAIRNRAPLVRVLDSAETANEGHFRIPTVAGQTIRAALANGPVLVSVPLTGYLPRFECQNCRTIARCQTCGGLLTIPDAAAIPSCRTCGKLQPGWQCPNCGSARIRAGQIGADRTADELGRAFPKTVTIVSSSTAPTGIKPQLPRPNKPALVVATPGAEPVMPGGYAAAVILDAGATLQQVSLELSGGTLQRWLAVAHLVVPAAAGGKVVLVGDADPGAVAGLLRFEPVVLAERELAERIEAGLPPATRFAEITGDGAAVELVLARIGLATPDNLLGPMPLEQPELEAPSPPELGEALFAEPKVRVLIKVPAALGGELALQLRASLAVRSAKREGGQLKARLDPII